jgi:hypothetical protein
MKSIIELQRALLADDADGVKAFIDNADRHSGNEAMLAASKALGFKVAYLNGWLVTTGAEIGALMGHTSDSAIRKLRRKYPVVTVSGGGSLPEFTKVKEIFCLDPSDGRTVFHWWDSILIAGARGKTPEADRVLLYLLDCERALRLLSNKDVRDSETLNIRRITELGKAVDRIRQAPDDPLRDLYVEQVESAFGIRIPKTGQDRLDLV